MTSSLRQAMHDFAAKYPTPAHHPLGGDGSWDQDCGRAMWRFGDYLGWRTAPAGDISSARRVADLSAARMPGGRLRLDVGAAEPGRAWHFWDIGGIDNGHVMLHADENTLTFGGTAAVWEELGGAVDLGFLSVDGYGAARPRATYLGWADNYAGGRMDLAILASSSTRPVVDPEPPATIEEGFTMAQRQYYARITEAGADDGEWMLGGVDVFADPDNDPEISKVWFRDGYAVTTDKETAKRWARQYGIGPNETRAVRLGRRDYIAQQGELTRQARAWRSGLGELIGDAIADRLVDLEPVEPVDELEG